MKPLRVFAGTFALVVALVAPIALAPAPSAQAFPTTVIPTCAQMFPKSSWSLLFPPGMVLSSDTVRTGASNARQTEIINGGEHRNCTWVDPTTKRSITVSVARIDIEEQREIRAWYLANGIPMISLAGGPANFAFVPHIAPRYEMHYTGTMFFIAIDDRGFGSLGASMQAVYATLLRLNPWMLPA